MTDKKPGLIDPRAEVLKILDRNAKREALVEAVVKAAREVKQDAQFGERLNNMYRAVAALDRFDAGEGR